MIFTKLPFSKKHRKNFDFGVVFGGKNHEKSKKIGLKTMCFFYFVFLAFSCDFSRFWLDFGRPRGLKKSMKNRKNRVQDGFGTRLGSSIDFGHDFGAILVDFGRILDGFWKDFGKIFGRI